MVAPNLGNSVGEGEAYTGLIALIDQRQELAARVLSELPPFPADVELADYSKEHTNNLHMLLPTKEQYLSEGKLWSDRFGKPSIKDAGEQKAWRTMVEREPAVFEAVLLLNDLYHYVVDEISIPDILQNYIGKLASDKFSDLAVRVKSGKIEILAQRYFGALGYMVVEVLKKVCEEQGVDYYEFCR
ncbi:hypothetical protein COZ14_01425 [Candidatus Dojkabacteria bacterium CG_4_10_14_3_um_filter_Dojkabacteria_WS6_41_9]|uniref:Uncharacterized protein n=1 Tax=Candidatus Dojkabacteria bacterium CG_4_10_14_0_2_um_filter_Dojkabacteria_WS6_41_15 TaxID=2014249 RepID=A0A2M7W214_9BACT|nr:MAG: hypothetical protein COZ14_01425 [Candidatus Dojkabacteria bacterium CG_4_10_14_3_um_filter_Dojkabacteria_WS6_41_9]PJA14072.1 MAG: hypothetical protein COX64_02475 [Candidatus Dojkabacteria bacterium CG_4_10_14_0_2_um_filter_Dojkabacteria_WS6_41_15]